MKKKPKVQRALTQAPAWVPVLAAIAFIIVLWPLHLPLLYAFCVFGGTYAAAALISYKPEQLELGIDAETYTDYLADRSAQLKRMAEKSSQLTDQDLKHTFGVLCAHGSDMVAFFRKNPGTYVMHRGSVLTLFSLTEQVIDGCVILLEGHQTRQTQAAIEKARSEYLPTLTVAFEEVSGNLRNNQVSAFNSKLLELTSALALQGITSVTDNKEDR